MTATDPHGCPTPGATRKKYRNSLWICDCGQGWRVKTTHTWAGEWNEWVRWPS